MEFVGLLCVVYSGIGDGIVGTGVGWIRDYLKEDNQRALIPKLTQQRAMKTGKLIGKETKNNQRLVGQGISP
jgi:hypothetical protein